MRTRIALGLAALLVSACGGPSATPTSTPAPSASPAACDNPEGGACVNALTPGREYVTSVFAPTITYRVVEEGWSNEEDTPGNFLLLPPDNDLAGVQTATSDFIGVYTSVAAATFTDLDGCRTRLLPDVPRTPRGLVAWMQAQRLLDVSRPVPVTLSGLDGLRTDVRIAGGQTPPTCTVDSLVFPVALLFSGVAPSSLDHGVEAGISMRHYLLRRGDDVMAVEVDDVDRAPGDLESLSAQVDRLSFG